MATLISYNTVEDGCFGVMRVIAKSGERITFPRPSDLSAPKIWANSPANPKTRVIHISNINCAVQFDGGGSSEVMIRYELKKPSRR